MADRHDTLEKHQQCWYYYLAEIASRHLTNRILEAHKEASGLHMVAYIKQMLKDVKIFEAQLQTWHASLPSSITFTLPWHTVEPLPNELIQHLRGRYMIISELMYRPFVCLCTSHRLDIPTEVLVQVASVASRCLHFCALRVSSTRRARHHGSWFQLRSFICCAMILIAAAKAQSDPNLNAAQMLQLPSTWKELIFEKREKLSASWSDERGGIAACARILDWALNEFT